MDKIATNNFIVTLRKDVKAAKAMVAGNLVRKIAQLREEMAKKPDDEVLKAKIETKIDKVHSEIKMLKTLDNYSICKDAILKPDVKYWNNKIGDSKAAPEDCLRARVISKTKVQKQVQNFRSQHVDCDEWLEEYFEFREKKHELMVATTAGKKMKMRRDRVREAREKRNKERLEKKKKLEQSAADEDHNDSTTSQTELNKEEEKLHPSWASKRREKELLKKAFSGISKVVDDQSAPEHKQKSLT